MGTLLADKTVAQRDTPHCKALHEAYDEMLAWLKSLRPQPNRNCKECAMFLNGKCTRPQWKPTDEQMEALEYVIRDYREDSCNATANYLQEILDHLKNM